MFLAQAVFGKAPREMDVAEVLEKVEGYLALLQKNGQIVGHALHAVSGGNVIAYANLVRPDSTARTYHSRYGNEELNALCALLGQEPGWKLLADNVPSEFPDVRGESGLYLYSSALDGQSPIRGLDTGDRLPTYLIPIEDDAREGLLFWSEEYNRMDGIWFSSGELEIPAYEQMASPTSCLARQGRELASLVESALNLPVYYFLMHYYGRGEQEQKRCCPGCGNSWRTGTDHQSTKFWNFPFRCEKCRLVSHFADAAYDDSFAHIGEFRADADDIAIEQTDKPDLE